jgi:hypothetical protein
LLELVGRGRGGIRIGLCLCVRDDKPGSVFQVVADLSGGLLSTPVGRLVAKVIESDVRKSVSKLATLR